MVRGYVRRRGVSGLLLAIVGLALALASELTGVFAGLDGILRGGYEARAGGLDGRLDVREFLGMCLAAGWCVGMAAMVFQCRGTGRRVALGVSGLVLAAGLSPSFAVWGVYWAPFPLVLGAGWAWASSMIYVASHPAVREHGNVIHMTVAKKAAVPKRREN